jgi:hypothetical protein
MNVNARKRAALSHQLGRREGFWTVLLGSGRRRWTARDFRRLEIN